MNEIYFVLGIIIGLWKFPLTVCIADVGIFETRPAGCDVDENCKDEIIEMISVRVQPQNQTCNIADAEVPMSRPNFGNALLYTAFEVVISLRMFQTSSETITRKLVGLGTADLRKVNNRSRW